MCDEEMQDHLDVDTFFFQSGTEAMNKSCTLLKVHKRAMGYGHNLSKEGV